MSTRIIFTILLALVALPMHGCQPVALMASAPPGKLAVDRSAAAPALATPDPHARMTLLYATTREPQGTGDWRRYGENVADELRFGAASLRVDEDAARAFERRAIRSSPKPSDRPDAHLERLVEQAVFAANADLDVLSPEMRRFFTGIDHALSLGPDKDVFVYVHGNNNGVYRTATQAARYSQSTGRNSVVFAFVWPTWDPVLNYGADVGAARRSVPAFARFIELLARHTRAEHINILSFSGGARIVSSALRALGAATPAAGHEGLRERLRLGEVYYTAADIEMREFVGDLEQYADLPLRVTLQLNRHDYILALLGAIPGTSRAGHANLDELNAAQRASLRDWANNSRLDLVDVASESWANIMSRGHAFWYDRPWVSTDVLMQFRYHASPGARGLEQAYADGVKRWVFPSDYEQRAATALAKLGLASRAAEQVPHEASLSGNGADLSF
jgi:esterase/lipase superfamily enzyme